MRKWALIPFGVSLTAFTPHRLLAALTMEAESQRPKGRENVISGLNAAIEAMNLAKEFSSITPAKPVFGTVSVILAMIRVSLLVCVDQPQAEMHSGLDDQPGGLRRTGASLR